MLYAPTTKSLIRATLVRVRERERVRGGVVVVVVIAVAAIHFIQTARFLSYQS